MWRLWSHSEYVLTHSHQCWLQPEPGCQRAWVMCTLKPGLDTLLQIRLQFSPVTLSLFPTSCWPQNPTQCFRLPSLSVEGSLSMWFLKTHVEWEESSSRRVSIRYKRLLPHRITGAGNKTSGDSGVFACWHLTDLSPIHIFIWNVFPLVVLHCLSFFSPFCPFPHRTPCPSL